MIRATQAAWRPLRLLLLVLMVNVSAISPINPEKLNAITDFQIIAGAWRGTLTGPRGTGPYELSINENGSWTAAGFGLSFKGSASLVNGKARFFSQTTNRAGTWTLTERDGHKRLLVLSDDQRSWGELVRTE
jgi:hypothetical protein